MESYKKVMWGSIVVVILLVAALSIYFFFIKHDNEGTSLSQSGQHSKPRVEKKAMPSDENRQPEVPQTDAGQLDFGLNNSDQPVREMLSVCSTHQKFVSWLKQSNLIRRCVAAVDNVSNGVSPAAHLGFMLKRAGFKAIKQGDQVKVDPMGYIRFQPVAIALVSMDTGELVAMYKKLLPLLEEAYQELGYPDKKFRRTLVEAFDVLLKTPLLEGDILLEEKVTSYAFKDQRLEALNDAQKHLLRMGPQNAAKILDKIKEISVALKEEGLM